MGVEPIMAEATARRQDWSAALGLRSLFGPEGPQTVDEVLRALEGSPHGRQEGPLEGRSRDNRPLPNEIV
jgi:hypothetical protein